MSDATRYEATTDGGIRNYYRSLRLVCDDVALADDQPVRKVVTGRKGAEIVTLTTVGTLRALPRYGRG